LKIPAPKGRNFTLTANVASPFPAEPKQGRQAFLISCTLTGNERQLALKSQSHRTADAFV